MDKKKKINRKTFFKWAGLALIIPLFKVWQNTVSRDRAFASSPQSLEIESDLPDGIYFHNRVILIKENSVLKLFSSKCTHLGCTINKVENGELVCPCHGSRYSFDGVPVKGPSVKQLTEIDFESDFLEDRIVLRYKL